MSRLTLGFYDDPIYDYPYQVPLSEVRSLHMIGVPGAGKSRFLFRQAETRIQDWRSITIAISPMPISLSLKNSWLCFAKCVRGIL